MRLGIWLMQRLSFTQKALLISSVFLLPLVLTASILTRDYFAQIEFIESEMDGVTALQGYVALSKLASDYRAIVDSRLIKAELPADIQSASARVEQVLDSLSNNQRGASLDRLALSNKISELKSQWSLVASGIEKGNADENAIRLWADNSLQTLQYISDQSGLVLDPELDVLYLGLAATQAFPVLVDNLLLARFGAMQIQRDATAVSDISGARARFAVYDTKAATALNDLRTFIEKAAKKSPEVLTTLDLSVLDRADAFRKATYAATMQESREKDVDFFRHEGAKVTDALHQMHMQTIPVMERLLRERISEYKSSRMVGLAVVLVCLSLAVYLYYAYYLATSTSLRTIRENLESLAVGDLRSVPAVSGGKDEESQTLHKLGIAWNSLRKLVHNVKATAQELQVASNEIAQVSLDLQTRTEGVAASLHQQSMSMTLIREAAKHTSELAARSAVFASSNADAAQRSGQIVEQVVANMDDLHRASIKVSDIAGIINSIAFQTKILALNAAVEAARAGDEGSGFAVVAWEVRKLAEQTSMAAKEIGTLVTESLSQVELTSGVVRSAGGVMKEVISNAQQLNGNMEDILQSANGQTTSVEQINGAMNILEKNTQQNAAVVEQSSAAAQSLRQSATNLLAEVATFKL